MGCVAGRGDGGCDLVAVWRRDIEMVVGFRQWDVLREKEMVLGIGDSGMKFGDWRQWDEIWGSDEVGRSGRAVDLVDCG